MGVECEGECCDCELKHAWFPVCELGFGDVVSDLGVCVVWLDVQVKLCCSFGLK